MDEIVIGGSTTEIEPQILDPEVRLLPRFDTLYYDIDLNNDGNQDLTLKAFASQFFGGLALIRSRMSLQTNNATTQVLTDSLHFVRMVAQNEIINREDTWEQGEFIMVTASDPCCPPIGPRGYIGPWRTLDTGYIAIKQNDCLGWIKAKVNSGSVLCIYEYAWQGPP
ncbi:MAG: hypothetical protein IPL46_25950 [Saprospiraceae bacterium]|nr:hypothetical protein [Saprospiraceae bacterium]